jgi:hypothetical protein
MPRTKESFFITLLVFLTLLNIYDFYNDYQENEQNPLNLAIEALIPSAIEFSVSIFFTIT